MASTYLTRTFGTATNRLKFTISTWVKKSQPGTGGNAQQFFNGYNSSTYRFLFYFDQTYNLHILNIDSGTTNVNLQTTRVLRDPNAWYHVYCAIDTAQATESDRVKIYINGVQETSFGTATYPAQNADMALGTSSYTCQIGRYGGDSDYFSGILSHYYYIDGSIIDVGQFGSTDATTGEWKINTSPTIASYGNEGFLILKDGNTITDQSPNSNDFTLGAGTLTNTEDNPSNVFATFNPLDVNKGTVVAFSNGNTTTMHNSGNNGIVTAARSTLAYSKGKFYWESKCIATGGDVRTGIISMSSSNYNTSTNPYVLNECYNYKQNANKGNSSGDTSYGATYTAGDIIGIAHDVSAGTLTFYKNGVSQGTAFTGLSTSITWGAFSTEYNTGKFDHNFGNGYFGTSAISSEGTNASNIGKFEYDVPTGFTALCTKGLNE